MNFSFTDWTFLYQIQVDTDGKGILRRLETCKNKDSLIVGWSCLLCTVKSTLTLFFKNFVKATFLITANSWFHDFSSWSEFLICSQYKVFVWEVFLSMTFLFSLVQRCPTFSVNLDGYQWQQQRRCFWMVRWVSICFYKLARWR